MQKVNIFIDAEYVLQSLRALEDKPRNMNISKYSFNWKNFISYILDGRDIGETYYYTARLDSSENTNTYDEQTKYLSNLEKLLQPYNFILRLGKMIKIKPKSEKTWNENREENSQKQNIKYSWVQKGIDTKIVLDLAKSIQESEYGTAIIVTGDEDFKEVMTFLIEKGKTIELISFNRYDTKLSKDIIDVPNKINTLNYEKLQKINVLGN